MQHSFSCRRQTRVILKDHHHNPMRLSLEDMYVIPPKCHWILTPCVVQTDGVAGSGVEAYDYTPYFYFIMAVIVVAHLQFTLLAKPNLKRAAADHSSGQTKP